MTYPSRGYRPGRLPRYQPKRFNPLPYLAAVGAILLFVVAIGVLMVAQPWVSHATPTPTLTPIPSIPTLPSPTPTQPEASPTPDGTDQLTPEPGSSMIVYVVKPGDSFNAIAARFHLTRAELLAANPQIKNPNNIYVGQKINIPVPSSTPQPTDVPTDVPTEAPTDTPGA